MMNNDQACCACLHVNYSPLEHADGSMSERWTCDSCGTPFVRRLRVDAELTRLSDIKEAPMNINDPDTETSLASNRNAVDWARAFVSRFGGDEGLMIGWFANAIMCGVDTEAERLESEIARLRDIKAKARAYFAEHERAVMGWSHTRTIAIDALHEACFPENKP